LKPDEIWHVLSVWMAVEKDAEISLQKCRIMHRVPDVIAKVWEKV